MRDEKNDSPLELWDPAADREPPGEELARRVRSRLAGAPAPVWRRQGRRRRRLELAFAAVAAVLLVVLSLGVARMTGAPEADVETDLGAEAPAREEAEVQMVYTASNGVRIYWSVRPGAGLQPGASR